MNPYLTNVLDVGPRVTARLCRRLATDQWDTPTGPGRFSPREVLAHLADWEPIFLARMRQAVEEPGSVIEPYDEGQRAIDNDYAGQDPDSNLAAFGRSRGETLAWLKGLEPAQMESHVAHPERGSMTVADMANMLLGHDLYHLDQLSEVVETRG